MKQRNLSPQRMFEQMASAHTPLHSFDASNNDFNAWKSRALPDVLATLGDWPETVDPDPALIAQWEEDGVVKQRWIIDVGLYISAVLVICRPQDLDMSARHPAILCWHGHGQFGKDSVMGNRSSTARVSEIEQHNYDYGHRMAKAGFITYAIDWIGIGERNDNNKPHFRSHNWGRDWCNLYYLSATMLGMTSLSINLAHGMAATGFVSELSYVDPDRLGVMGLSGGGTMTVWTAITDNRIKAAEVICYSGMWEHFGIRDLNICGMQIAPGLYKLVNMPELQGLIAPKPLLVDIGAYDTCFPVETAMQCFNKLKTIYEAAGASDRLELDFFPGEHSWGGNKSVEFFDKWL